MQKIAWHDNKSSLGGISFHGNLSLAYLNLYKTEVPDERPDLLR